MGESRLWIHHHRPSTLKSVPQPEGIIKLAQFVNTFSKQKKKAMLLYGPSGTGKSCAVHALARDLNWEIVEVNASDVRNEEQINERLGNALKQRSLFFAGKLILVDEIDGVSGTDDRGGITALVDLIAKTRFPIIMTAQDPWDKKFSALRSKSVLVEFPSLPADSIVSVLQEICSKEKVMAEQPAVKAIARRSGGDMRSAINDLQLLSEGSGKLTQDSLAVLGERNRLEQIETALVKVFKNSDPLLALGAFDQTDTDIDEIFLWLDHNLAREYENPKDRVRAYDILSRADVFRGRIRRQQHWRFLSHIFELLTAGIAVAKDAKSKNPPKYERSSRLLKIWMANMKYSKRKAIAQKIADATHSSSKTALHHTLPALQVVIRNNQEQEKILAEELDLDDEEVEWLKK
ncbi:MAG: replication factor C large subunit [Candidatus Woesearchaeota archaeon]